VRGTKLDDVLGAYTRMGYSPLIRYGEALELNFIDTGAFLTSRAPALDSLGGSEYFPSLPPLADRGAYCNRSF
jgi:hypothetical protein